jgi:hypothetical protein
MVDLSELMCGLQVFLRQSEFDFIHPDSLHFIVRQTGKEFPVIARIQVAFVVGGDVWGLAQSMPEFDDFLVKVRAFLNEIQNHQALSPGCINTAQPRKHSMPLCAAVCTVQSTVHILRNFSVFTILPLSQLPLCPGRIRPNSHTNRGSL